MKIPPKTPRAGQARTVAAVRTCLLACTILASASSVAKVQEIDISNDGDAYAYAPTIEVVQQLGPDGKLVYGSTVQDSVTFRTRLSGKCRSAYRLSGAWLNAGHHNLYTEGTFNTQNLFELPVTEADYEEELPYTAGNRTFGPRLHQFEVPLANLLMDGFDPVAEAENWMNGQAANDAEEEALRAQDQSLYASYRLSLTLRCKTAVGYTGLDKWYDSDSHYFNVRVRLIGDVAPDRVPSDGPTRDPSPAPTTEALAPAEVTQAELFVNPDLEDECKLHISAALTADRGTDVTYRFLNELGMPSNSFVTHVDDNTLTEFVHHIIDLSVQESGSGGFGYAPNPRPFDGIDGYAAQDTDLVQGHFRLQVVEPNHVLSNTADFSLDCQPHAPSREIVPLTSRRDLPVSTLDAGLPTNRIDGSLGR